MRIKYITTALLIFSISSLFAIKKEDVLTKIKAVSDKIINETSFELQSVKYSTGQGVERVDFSSVFNCEKDKKQYARTLIKATETKEYTLGFSYRGNITVWINNQEVFQESATDYTIAEYSYGWFHFNKTIHTNLNEGENSILVQLTNTEAPIFFVRAITEELVQDKNISFNNPLEAESSKKWLLCGNLSENDNPSKNIKNSYSKNGNITVWQTQPDFYINKLKTPEKASYQRDPYSDWHYANGGTMFGILALYDITQDNIYFDFVEKFALSTAEYYDSFNWQYNTMNTFKGSYCRLFRLTMLDDSGGPAIPVAELYKRNKNPEYQKILSPVTNYVLNKQQRLPDGTFSRPEPENNTVWSDDLFMSVPYLLRVAEYENKPELYDEIANQILNFHKYLYNKKSGIYYHCWLDEKKEQSVAQWGRSNGWLVWAITEALKYMPTTHKDYKKIMKVYKQYMTSLVKYQDKSGLWHQLIDKDDSYLETSCSAMFTLGLARGINNGWLSSDFEKYALKGWQGIDSKIDENGTVHTICRGTGLGYDLDFYYNRATFDHDPRGLGAVLTAGAEIYTMLNNKK